jgi:hypothetical protein
MQGAQLVCLGTGDSALEDGLRWLENTYPDQVRKHCLDGTCHDASSRLRMKLGELIDLMQVAAPLARAQLLCASSACQQSLEQGSRFTVAFVQARGWVGFNVPFSHRLTAGADVLLMPSRFEPCGLNQMYAMAYGAQPALPVPVQWSVLCVGHVLILACELGQIIHCGIMCDGVRCIVAGCGTALTRSHFQYTCGSDQACAGAATSGTESVRMSHATNAAVVHAPCLARV